MHLANELPHHVRRSDVPRGRRRPHRLLRQPPLRRLRTEFEQRLKELLEAGERPDPRDAQVARLKDEIVRLKERLAQSDATISELASFRDQALARLAAQHDEITRLRQEVQLAARIRRLPVPAAKEQNLS